MPEVFGYGKGIAAGLPEPHGGNIYRAAEELGIAESEITDFSASINPLGVPKGAANAIKDCISCLPNYPDPDTVRLRKEIAGHQGIDMRSVVCGNGSTELFYIIVRALKPQRALIPAPSFSEYLRAFEVFAKDHNPSAKAEYFILWEKDDFVLNVDSFISTLTDGTDIETARKSPMMNTPDIVFLCNPNNPTGGLLNRQEVLKIAEAARALKCYLVVDEAFIDFCPEHSVIRDVANNPYLIVIRSLTKFFALSGLRIGYGVFPLQMVELIKRYKEPWTVNSLSQAASIAAMRDKAYISQSLKLIQEEKVTIEDGLKVLKLKYYPSAANFYLFRFDKKIDLTGYLKGKGILIRDCSNFIGLDRTYFRTAVKGNKDNMRLLKELAKACLG